MHLDKVSCIFFDLSGIKARIVGRSFIMRGVGPFSIVVSDPAFDNAFGLEAVVQFVRVDCVLR